MSPIPTARTIRALARAVIVAALSMGTAPAAEAPATRSEIADAWLSLPTYRSGDDLAPLLAIEREAIAGMATNESRAAFAARLAAVLGQPGATPAARQWVCLLLRQVGTPAEVPILARELSGSDGETADAARQAIESIPGGRASEALREFLPQAQGGMRLGIIAALGRRRDVAAVPLLAKLAAGEDAAVATAATGALGLITDPTAIATLRLLAEKSGVPTPRPLGEPLLRAVDAAARAGDRSGSHEIQELLSRQGQPATLRQAALQGLLDTAAEDQAATILEWLAGTDADRRAVAAGSVGALDDAALAAALNTLDRYSAPGQQAIVTVACRRIPRTALPALIQLAAAGTGDLQVLAIECLGRIGTSEGLPTLLSVLTDSGSDEAASPAQAAAWNALAAMPREIVGPRLVAVLAADPAPRQDVVALIGEIRESTAWDPLARVALAKSPAPWQAAIASLGMLARPEAGDLTRMVELFSSAQESDRREAVSRMIAIVCRKSAGDEPAATVITELDRKGIPEDLALPLLGRLGGPEALAKIDAGLVSADRRIRDAAIEGLCNWPDASVADRLLALAREALDDPERQAIGRQALRAYVRTVSLKSERSAEATLAMLEGAMALAADGPTEDRGFILERTAAAVRTMDAVEWLAGYLDDPSTAQAACRGLVGLAHHKDLRRPNLERFRTLLDRVATLAEDPAVANRAQRYRLGL
ncbi:MAG: hypothetical protein K8S94_11345 [Planctomycetia bacterium]|nr:hypothetical protein [Planctomycetia bacterium]